MRCALFMAAVRSWYDSLPAAAQAKEFGEAEVWMNERLMRAAPRQFAEFVTAFEDRDALVRRGAEPLWLVTLLNPSNHAASADAWLRAACNVVASDRGCRPTGSSFFACASSPAWWCLPNKRLLKACRCQACAGMRSCSGIFGF